MLSDVISDRVVNTFSDDSIGDSNNRFSDTHIIYDGGTRGSLRSELYKKRRKMSKLLINEDSLTSIADAIRSKTGGGALLTPSQMAKEIGGLSGDLEITNGTIINLPAYLENIPKDTFVSTTTPQSNYKRILLEDVGIGSSDSTNMYGARTFQIDENHYIIIMIDYDKKVQVRIITYDSINDSYTNNDTYIGNAYIDYAYSGIYAAITQIDAKTYVADRFIIQIDDDYKVTSKTYDYEIQSNGYTYITTLSSCGQNYIAISTAYTRTNGSSPTNYYVHLYHWENDTLNQVARLYTSSSGCKLYTLALLENDYFVAVGYSDEDINLFKNNKDGTITLIASDSFGTDKSNNTRCLIHLKDNYYALVGYQMVYLLEITTTTITSKAYAATSINAEMGIYPEDIVHDGDTIYLITRGSLQHKITFGYEPFAIEVSTFSGWSAVDGRGGWSMNNKTWRGTYVKKNNAVSLIIEYNFDKYQECIKNSLDTGVITGITLDDCTETIPGRVCILNSGVELTSYGLQENVVAQVTDDSIDEIKQEVII